MNTTPACMAQVSEPPHYIHSHQCSRSAKTEVHGVPLCSQHAKRAQRPKDFVHLWPKGTLYSNGERSES